MEQKPGQPQKISRRTFLRRASELAGGAILVGAGLSGEKKPNYQPAQAANEPGRRPVVEKRAEVAVVATEAPQPRPAELEDLLVVGYVQVGVSQGEGQKFPPQEIERGPGFFVTSKMEGMVLPVSDQEGPIFYQSGYKGEATQGGTVIGEGGGVTVVQDPDKIGSGANVYTSLVLGTNQKEEALQFSWDNAFFVYNKDNSLNPDLTLVPDRAVITVEGRSGKVTHVVEGGAKGKIGWQFLIPLGGFQPQLEEGIDGRNIVPGVKDSYSEVNTVSICLQDGQKKLTFNYEKKGRPEPVAQG